MAPSRPTAVLLLLAVVCLSWQQRAGAATVCLLKLTIDPKQSAWSGSGKTTAPIEGKISASTLAAKGNIWLHVPSNSSCPPTLTAASVDDLLMGSSLEVPVDSPSITFTPGNIRNNVSSVEPGAAPFAQMDFLGLGMGLTGTEPLGPGTVVVGKGSVAEARSAAAKVCSQLLLLNGTLDLSSKLAGKRTAEVKNVAYNRTLSAGVSVAKSGEKVSNATLFLSNVTLFLNITPETKDGKGTPGVEFSTASYTLSGNIVATADLSKAASWQTVKLDDVAWGTVRRLDSPVVIGAPRPGKPRFIGENSTIEQQCKPSRVLDATNTAAAGGSTAKSAAQGAAAGMGQALLAAAAAAAALLL